MSFLGEETLTRRRFAPGHRDHGTGRWVDGVPTDTPFRGSVQPVGRADREGLPEGIRSRVERKVYAPRGTLRAADQHLGVMGDHVVRGGLVYEVVYAEADLHPLLPHDKAFVVLLKEEG